MALSKEEYQRAREICEKATPPPWSVYGIKQGFQCPQKDAYFVAESRILLPKALDEIDRLKELLKKHGDCTCGYVITDCICGWSEIEKELNQCH